MKIRIPDPDAKWLVRYHFLMMIVWPALLIPTLIWWKQSILWIATMSLYANWASHFSGWDAARAEQAQEDQATAE